MRRRRKMNCWEYQGCGREPGGARVDELGVCRAVLEHRLHGQNRGINGGRACWVVPDTLCNGTAFSGFDEKYAYCRTCVFFELVRHEEGGYYVDYPTLLRKLSSEPGPRPA